MFCLLNVCLSCYLTKFHTAIFSRVGSKSEQLGNALKHFLNGICLTYKTIKTVVFSRWQLSVGNTSLLLVYNILWKPQCKTNDVNKNKCSFTPTGFNSTACLGLFVCLITKTSRFFLNFFLEYFYFLHV